MHYVILLYQSVNTKLAKLCQCKAKMYFNWDSRRADTVHNLVRGNSFAKFTE